MQFTSDCQCSRSHSASVCCELLCVVPEGDFRKVTCRLSTLVGTAIRMASMQKLGIQEACTAAHSLTALTAHLESVMLGDVKTASKP